MANWLNAFLLLLFISIECSVSQLSRNKHDLLNWCLNSISHKHEPGIEDSLYKECSPWKSHSCCTSNTSVNIHEINMYNFTFDHCLEQTGNMMSDSCRKHFVRDNCFYHCEPHIGVWVVKTKRKIASERFFKVPLCASDCEAWFEDCRNDFTCAHNWPRDFVFSQGQNACNKTSECIKFEDMYLTAKEFCENVWDESWKYTPDDEPCMHVWFEGSSMNPNKKVAEFYIDKFLNSASSISLSVWLICLVLASCKIRIL